MMVRWQCATEAAAQRLSLGAPVFEYGVPQPGQACTGCQLKLRPTPNGAATPRHTSSSSSSSSSSASASANASSIK